MIKKEIKEPTEDIRKLKTIYSFYANIFQPRWAKNEFLLEFAQDPLDDDDDLAPACRIYVPPNFIKVIIEALQDSIKNYEMEHKKSKK